MNELKKVINFDPNFNYAGQMSKKSIKLVFALWEYRVEKVLELCGNIQGLSVFDVAVDALYEQLLNENEDYPYLELTNKYGATLTTYDEERQASDWLKNMLICAEIIKYELFNGENNDD